ncbi:uncharacterized protein LOC114731740 isoform X2 [Neltuma alba]|uniref:uncharacterized protein LOC114731740 isoform X2 n=1 Tax=Neltuma alba TaxID=207710 RepID=UPI0010A2EC2D|nr:uncharacterized protein LOC114731740 isoform X2 [Prosopis alba]
MASVQCQKHNEMCPKQSHHTKLGQKICEMTNKAFKSQGNANTNTNINTSSKTETHCYTETQSSPKNLTEQGESKTEISLLIVQARITQTNANHPPALPRGTATTCFGNPNWKNRDHTNKKDRNLFRRIKDGVSRHNNCDSDSSSDSDSDKENCRTRKK